MPAPRFSFVGDDFTGSTDALELLASAGLRVKLFVRPPTATQSAGLDAVGVATRTRSMPPAAMTPVLEQAFAALVQIGCPVIHYKVCSTWDSSPAVGSIGCAIDLGIRATQADVVPLVGGTPSLGRWCVFGHLFAAFGVDRQPYRIDRHPSMKHHPVTPMHESDLRLHLAAQTSRPIRLVDVRVLEAGIDVVRQQLASSTASGDCVLFDALTEAHLKTIGLVLEAGFRFLVGPSSIESALAPLLARSISAPQWTPPPTGPVLVLSGSCSPVTAGQLEHAREHGFADAGIIDNLEDTARAASQALASGQHAIVHTRAGSHRTSDASEVHSHRLAHTARLVLDRVRPSRLVIAGGDTSGLIAEALGVESMTMIAPFVRGAPWCRLDAPGSPADRLPAIFKGGQVGARSMLVDATGETP